MKGLSLACELGVVIFEDDRRKTNKRPERVALANPCADSVAKRYHSIVLGIRPVGISNAKPLRASIPFWRLLSSFPMRWGFCGLVFALTICGGCATAPLNQNVDRIVIDKSAHTMTLMNNGQPLKTFKVAIGGGGPGPKEQRGDRKTPEGDYVIDERKDLTCCYLAFHLSYPNANDIAHAQAMGVDPGDMIEIHGLPKSRKWLGRFHRISDWTAGCIAVDDTQMLEMWPYVPVGTPVEIDP